MVDAEITAAATGRVELAAAPAPPSVPQRVSDVPEGLAGSFFMQLGAEPDTPMDDIWMVPETDLKDTLAAMTFLGPIQKGKVIREIREQWTNAGYDPPGLGAPASRPALPAAARSGPRRCGQSTCCTPAEVQFHAVY